jgi:hypothetical protein
MSVNSRQNIVYEASCQGCLKELDSVIGRRPCAPEKVAVTRVARFFLVHDTKTGKNVPHEHKMYQDVPDVRKIFYMAKKKYIHFFPI